MKLEKKKLIRSISAWVTLALVALFCVSIAATCFHIYKTEGDTPFSRETVGAHAVYFLPQMIAAVAAVIASGVIALTLREEDERLLAPRDEYKTLKRVTAAAKKKHPDAPIPVSALGERGLRRIFLLIFSVAALVFIIFSLIFALDGSRYSLDDINGDILKVALVILPSFIALALLGYLLDRLARLSAERECAMIKATFTDGETERTQLRCCSVLRVLGTIEAFFAKPLVLMITRCLVLTVSVVFIILGTVNGGMSDVLGKAVRICTECIGLG